jgi:Na+-transporting methylmalonyl-CoA/oxaloacetate decarboxylase gamma subunit
MMTRDSHWWWVVMGGALIIGVSSRMDLLDPLLPVQHTATVHAFIELLAYLVGIASGVMRMSPLPISPEGRADIVEKNAAKADTATVAATVAAVKAGEAVQATTAAADAAQIASDESKKAANIP